MQHTNTWIVIAFREFLGRLSWTSGEVTLLCRFSTINYTLLLSWSACSRTLVKYTIISFKSVVAHCRDSKWQHSVTQCYFHRLNDTISAYHWPRSSAPLQKSTGSCITLLWRSCHECVLAIWRINFLYFAIVRSYAGFVFYLNSFTAWHGARSPAGVIWFDVTTFS